MVATLVAFSNGTEVPQAGVHFLRVGSESLLPQNLSFLLGFSQYLLILLAFLVI
jgi:hypothetical protein